jgi:hypothetical protein
MLFPSMVIGLKLKNRTIKGHLFKREQVALFLWEFHKLKVSSQKI